MVRGREGCVCLYEKDVRFRRNRVQRMSSFEAEPGQEVAASFNGSRIRPDIPAPREQSGAIGSARCVVDAKQAALPE